MVLVRDYNKESKDFFTKPFVHDKLVTFEHGFKSTPQVLKNTIHFSHNNLFAWTSQYNFDEKFLKAELKLNDASSTFRIQNTIPNFPKFSLGASGKRATTTKAAAEDVEIFSEYNDKCVQSKFQVFPMKNTYAFNLSAMSGRFGVCRMGAEATGSFQPAKPRVALGTAYSRQIDDRLFAMALTTNPDKISQFASIRFNFHTANKVQQNFISTDIALAVREQKVNANIGGKFLLNNDPTTELAAKVHNSGKFALALKYVLNPILTGTLGLQVDPAVFPAPNAVTYGFKFNLTT